MKIVWKKKVASGKKRPRAKPLAPNPNLPFEREEEAEVFDQGDGKRGIDTEDFSSSVDQEQKTMAESFESEGNQLAEDGKYIEALQKWEAAIRLMPERVILHEQQAQVLLEMGDAWGALKAATRATELEPLWAESWMTLGRAQLNYGEPDWAVKSFDKALEIKPSHGETVIDRETALQLVKRRKQLHAMDSGINQVRYKVGEKVEASNLPIPTENTDCDTLRSEDEYQTEKQTAGEQHLL